MTTKRFMRGKSTKDCNSLENVTGCRLAVDVTLMQRFAGILRYVLTRGGAQGAIDLEL